MKEQQNEVQEFVEKNNLQTEPAFRIMDLVAELGEVVADATKSSHYGKHKGELKVKEDEVGDVLFSLCALCNNLDIDAEEAFDQAMEKYEERIQDKGEPSSK